MSDPVEAILAVLIGLAWGFIAIAGAVYGLAAMVDAASKDKRERDERE